jgi:hypothetical protein
MSPIPLLTLEGAGLAHHAIPVQLHPASTESVWPAIITAVATAMLAFLAFLQIRAGKAQTREQADALMRQWQPRVCAHRFIGTYERPALLSDQMPVPYFLTNDGTGPAFNVTYGIELAGTRCASSEYVYRVLRPGEEAPQATGKNLEHWLIPIVEIVDKDGRNTHEVEQALVYWTEFDNLMGERFEVRNHFDPAQVVEFRRVP